MTRRAALRLYDERIVKYSADCAPPPATLVVYLPAALTRLPIKKGILREMQLKDAIGSFLVEFSKFENHSVGMALRALSKDPLFVEHAEQLLDLEARLKLLERLAFARGVPPHLIAELEACLLHARKLLEHHDEVRRKMTAPSAAAAAAAAKKVAGSARFRLSARQNADFSTLAHVENLWQPAVERVQEYAREAVELQEALKGITQKLEGDAPGLATGTG
jgi:hypothetical protein